MGSLHVLKRQSIELRELGADTVAIDMHIAQPEREREEKQLGWILMMEGVLAIMESLLGLFDCINAEEVDFLVRQFADCIC